MHFFFAVNVILKSMFKHYHSDNRDHRNVFYSLFFISSHLYTNRCEYCTILNHSAEKKKVGTMALRKCYDTTYIVAGISEKELISCGSVTSTKLALVLIWW